MGEAATDTSSDGRGARGRERAHHGSAHLSKGALSAGERAAFGLALVEIEHQYLSPALDAVLTLSPRLLAMCEAQRAVLTGLEYVAGVCPTCGHLREMGHDDACAWVRVMRG